MRLAVPRLTGDDEARGRASVDAGDSRASLLADIDFHSLVHELSGNGLIGESLRLHWRPLRRAMGEVPSRPGMSVSVWQEHGRIFDARAASDGDGAAELIRRHVTDAFERVRRS